MKQNVIRNRNGLTPAKYRDLAKVISLSHSLALLEQYFHPEGMKCSHCGEKSRIGGGKTPKGVPRFRCANSTCGITYTVLSGTIFSGSKMGPKEIVLFMFLSSIDADPELIGAEVGLGRPAVRIIQQKVALYGQYESLSKTI